MQPLLRFVIHTKLATYVSYTLDQNPALVLGETQSRSLLDFPLQRGSDWTECGMASS